MRCIAAVPSKARTGVDSAIAPMTAFGKRSYLSIHLPIQRCTHIYICVHIPLSIATVPSKTSTGADAAMAPMTAFGKRSYLSIYLPSYLPL